jgi:uncharacterized protein YbaA (DUF1428 family)
MAYVDGFIVPLPKKNLKAYLALERKCGKLWMKHGALSYVSCAQYDVKPGKLTSFPQSVKLKKDEIVVFAWITYTSRKHRDVVIKRVMSEPFMKQFDPKTAPFDGSRMIMGGFRTILAL